MVRFLISALFMLCLVSISFSISPDSDSEFKKLTDKCTKECVRQKKKNCNSVQNGVEEYIVARRNYHKVGDQRGYYHPTGSYWYQELLDLELKIELKKRAVKSFCPETMSREKD